MQDELKKEIEHYKTRCEWQAFRGRTSGTYDHGRLKQLLAYQKNLRAEAKAKAAAAKTKKVTKESN